MTRIDDFAPVWHFREVHAISVQATPDRAYRAIRAVTAREIRFFRSLVWLRRLGRRGPESILNPPGDAPILDVATRSGFVLLADEPDQELVVGTVVVAPRSARRPWLVEEFRSLDAPGYAKAVWLPDREGGPRRLRREDGDARLCDGPADPAAVRPVPVAHPTVERAHPLPPLASRSSSHRRWCRGSHGFS